jgi:hypothetical protein
MAQSYPTDVMYDIACTLKKHIMEVSNMILILWVYCVYIQEDRLWGSVGKGFALPSFRHKPQCQVFLGPIRCTGLGLSDGEVMEHLWSYLRCFSCMTEGMRPSHRTDILCHALIYYGMKTKQKLDLKISWLSWSWNMVLQSDGIRTTHNILVQDYIDCLREKKQNLQSSLWATISRIKAVPFKVEEKICWWTEDCEKALQGYLKGIQ